ncbi:unnamed protein product [Mytilus edulis]|uniref:Uncharacterized protein n=1 Tax=Mytilus edulis TaxID=6550 RepID=A0A8S3UI86_MYTED|nr:unnamed protein product [Mytilus edulis]
MSTYTPSSFPLSSRRRLIAPYWADTDTREGGDVWYRESTNLTLLGKATGEIHNIFPEHFNFHAAWIFIATWDNVAFMDLIPLASERHSFTIFLYDKIEWTTGTASDGDSTSGLGGIPAQVGFDAGDGLNFYAIDASRTSNIINVTKMSNIDFPGKFIFRVDSTLIKKGGCNVGGTLTITPKEAAMVGGTNLIISGPCFNLSREINLWVSDGKGVPCHKFNEFSVSCISPKFTGLERKMLCCVSHRQTTIRHFSFLEFENCPYYWSDMFTVNVGFEHSQAVCENFLNEDGNFPPIDTDDVQPCPCTLSVASLDTTRFSVDPFCHKQEGSAYKCANQPFAQVCFRQNVASSRGYDNQCCYDEVGVLMNPSGYYGSGYVNRYHYHGDGVENIPFFSNFIYDTIPYEHCCIYTAEDSEEVNLNSGSCASFYTRRPPNSCLNYIPPRAARVSGDPHFVTFDGHSYTFNPAGEFAALSNGNLSLQLRMEQIGSFQASSVTSFVARPYIGADTIEVQTNQIQGVDVLVNGILLDLDSIISKVNSVEGTTIEKISDDPPTVVTTFYTEGLSIRSSSQQNVLNLIILTSPDKQTGNLTGLFGDNDGVKDNDLVSKHKDVIDGNSSASDIHHRFGLSSVSCGFAFNASNAIWNYNGLTAGSIALLNCSKGYYVPFDVKLECLSSGNWSSVNTSCIPYCGGPPSVPNATWLPDLDKNGKRGTLRCKNGFYGKEIEISCTDNGTWTKFDIHCDPATTTRTVDQTVETSSEVHSSATTISELSTTMSATHIFSKTSTPTTSETTTRSVVGKSSSTTKSLNSDNSIRLTRQLILRLQHLQQF